MRKPYQLLLFMLGALVFASPFVAMADEVTDDQNTPEAYRLHSLRTSATQLRTSLANDPDTVWIGHIQGSTFVPKDRLGVDVPNSARDANGAPTTFGTVPVGGYGSFHVGRGTMRPGGDVSMGVAGGPGTSFNGIWDFDHFQAGDDTLMGWTPIARPGQSEGAGNADDKKRGFFGLDYGNQGNYVINQGAANKRTFGVMGYWHRDAGSGAPGGVGGNGTVTWPPIGGSNSAWCGLRVEGDNTAVDAITGNAISSQLLQYNGNNSYNQVGSINSTGTDHNFPGVGSQWDQMLYRDIDVSNFISTDNLTVSFSYVHALAPDRGGTSTQRIGYFWKDPLTYNSGLATGQANFISAADAEAALAGPTDSFTVMIGVPEEGTYVASSFTVNPIYDAQRRWFSEVIRTNDTPIIPGIAIQAPMVELLARSRFSTAGASGATVLPSAVPPGVATFTTDIPMSALGVIGDGTHGAGKVRLVFRVKTNRGFDDEDAFVSLFSSSTRGAAIVDDVVIQKNGTGGNLITNGDFESASSIDNATGVTATTAWKSTGKPPGVYAHPHCVNSNCVQYTPGLWNDPCSPPDLSNASAPNRACAMVGNVLSGGDHDNTEKPGGTFGAPDQDRSRLAVSPVIITATDPDPSNYNAMGLNRDIITNATEWALWFDIHTAGFRGAGGNGNLRSVGLQSWPASQPNGAKVWGEHRWSTGITFNTSNTCERNFVALKSVGFVITSNASGVPDSVRAYLQYISRCYTTSLTSSTCSPTMGQFVGNYIDNLSFAFIKGTPTAGLSNSPWMWFCDAFPAYINPDTGLPKTDFSAAAFDTATAMVKSAINRATTTSNALRMSAAGDSAQVTTGAIPGGGRVDLVFRILPGPGNYVTIGDRTSAIRKVPTSTTAAVADASSTNFWENYMANTGAYGTGGNGTVGVAHTPADRWDPNTWNSARMDTLERNLWPALSNSSNLAANSGGSDWQTTYHELDPRYTLLGIAKNRCFLMDPNAGQPLACSSKAPLTTADCNLVCQQFTSYTSVVNRFYPPTWAAAVGYVAENGLPLGQTYEFTKIIPDGQLTPGSHVQYFFSRTPGQGAATSLWPDTTRIFDSSPDGGRWFHFSVLPDNWKQVAYGGDGMACMLVVDNFDASGDEFYWISAADSIGLTSAAKRGAHNGYYATGGTNTPGTFSEAILRPDNGGQPGTLFDLWNTRAGGSLTTGAAWLASRLTTQPAAGSWMDGKTTRIGPTGDMLRAFYRSIVWLTGTAVSSNFGSVADRGDDDIALMLDFVNQTLTPGARSVMFWGSGLAENLTGAGGGPIPTGGVSFLSNVLGASLTNKSYRTYSGNLAQVAQYYEAPGSAHALAGIMTDPAVSYGLSDGCGIENDVLALSGSASAPGAAIQTYSENYGSSGPYGASIWVPSDGPSGVHPGITLLDGTRIDRVGSYNSDSWGRGVLPMARRGFLYNVLKNIAITAGQVACQPLAAPIGVGDAPGSGGGTAFVNFMNLRSSNPMRSGEARLVFGLARTEKAVVKVYDVTGRSVKTVSNRVFAAGQEHVVIWNGTDEAGNRVRSGVYFYQLRTPTWTSQKKLTLLRN